MMMMLIDAMWLKVEKEKASILFAPIYFVWLLNKLVYVSL